MNHDRLFKKLLTTFFFEFIDIFLPDVSNHVDKEIGFHPMSNELLTDGRAGGLHRVDILMKAKIRGKETCFLIHVEAESTSRSHFPERMFAYFARLFEMYKLPVFPVVVLSYDAPFRQPSEAHIGPPGDGTCQ